MKFLSLGSKSIRIDKIEAITCYLNELIVHCSNNQYVIYYSTALDAQEAYANALKILEREVQG